MIGASTYHKAPATITSTQMVARRSAAPVPVLAPSKTKRPGPSRRLWNSRRRLKVIREVDVEDATRSWHCGGYTIQRRRLGVDPPVNVRGRSSNRVSEPNRCVYTHRVHPRGPWRRGGLARRALGRQKGRLGPRRGVAPGVHQHRFQKPSPLAKLFVTDPCQTPQELRSERRDAAPLGRIVQKPRFLAPVLDAARTDLSAVFAAAARE